MRSLVTLLLVGLSLHATAQTARVLRVADDNVTITRNRYGVPHVTANTVRGLLYGNGYAIAEDRLGQMELYRRNARGEMAELVGKDAVAADRETRIDGYTEAQREQQFSRLPADLRAMFEAYADGVNAYIDELKANPRELRAANFPGKLDPAKLRAWRVTDSVAIGQMMARRFGGDEGGELRNQMILTMLKTRFGKDAMRVFNDLTWRNDPLAPTTIPATPAQRAAAARRPHWADANGKLIPPAVSANTLSGAIGVLEQDQRMALAQRYGLMTKWGSYAIAVSARKSAGGYAMLVGGPQMGFRTPQIAHEVHLTGAGLDIVGMGFAGVPGVLIGHNPYLAWTTTTGVNDQTDIFVETLNPKDPTQYRYKGQWVNAEKRVETIEVAGGQPVKLEVYTTVHGPIVQLDLERHLAYARCASYQGLELGTFEAEAIFAKARTVKQFEKGCALITTSHNFLCATNSGDIGYWFCGRTPLRDPRVDPRLPTPGDGTREWRGFMPFSQMPHCINPAQGYLANWNNKPAVWWDNQDSPVWGQVWRSARIEQLMRAKSTVSAEDLRNVLLDIGTHDINAQEMLPVLRDALKQAPGVLTPPARQAANYLMAWDCHATDGSVAKTMADAWIGKVRDGLFWKAFSFVGDRGLYEKAMQPSYVLHALGGKRASVPTQYDYLQGRSAQRVVLEALNDAVAELAKQRGDRMERWRYEQPTINFLPIASIPWTNRGTYIQIVECTASGVRGRSICPPGQSERADSPHFDDQRELAGWFQFKPMEE